LVLRGLAVVLRDRVRGFFFAPLLAGASSAPEFSDSLI
jgi:hypothetical protein